MEPFFFGEASRPLYGVHHPAVGRCDRGMAVLVCYPLGREYMRSHALVVELCELLTRSGIHALRFDYYATGDSAGEDAEATSEEWVANVEAAADEIKDITGVQRVCGVGLRLGATLLALAASRRDDFERVVLWDPIVSGECYMKTLEHLHREFVSDLNHFPSPRHEALGDKRQELLGYGFPHKMRDSIVQMNLLKLARPVAPSTAVCSSSGFSVLSAFDDATVLQHRLRQLGGEVQSYVVDEPVAWDMVELKRIIAHRMPVVIRDFIVEGSHERTRL